MAGILCLAFRAGQVREIPHGGGRGEYGFLRQKLSTSHMNGESVIWNPSRLLFRIASAW